MANREGRSGGVEDHQRGILKKELSENIHLLRWNLDGTLGNNINVAMGI